MSNKEIAKYYADENIVRLIAALVSILTLLSLLNHWTFPLLLLTIDFALRAFTYQPAPLAAAARIISVLLKLKPKPVFAAPKKFAAGLGFVCSATTFILFIFKLYFAAYIIGGLLIFFAVLESVFRVCIGCYIYNHIIAPFVNKRNN